MKAIEQYIPFMLFSFNVPVLEKEICFFLSFQFWIPLGVNGLEMLRNPLFDQLTILSKHYRAHI